MKPHIVQVVGIMNRGGAETMLMDIFRQLHHDYTFTFVIHYKGAVVPIGDFDEEISALGGRIEHVRSVWEQGIFSYHKKLRDLLIRLKPIHAVHSHLNSKGGTISWAARSAGISRIYVHSHADIHFTGSLIKRLLLSAELEFQKVLISRFADINLACSPAAMKSLFYNRDIRRKKSIVVNNAIDINKFTDCANVEKPASSTLTLGTVGRIAKIKRYELIIETLNVLRNRKFNFKFIFAGANQDVSYTKAIFELIEKYGLKEYVQWLGCRDDIQNVYPQMDLFLGASLSEGLGMSAVECQACGVPCLLSTGFPLSADIGAGLVRFIGSDSPETWADAIVSTSFPIHVPCHKLRTCLRESGFDINYEIEKVKTLYNE